VITRQLHVGESLPVKDHCAAQPTTEEDYRKWKLRNRSSKSGNDV